MTVFVITVTNEVTNQNGKMTLKAMYKCSIKVFFITTTNVVINPTIKVSLKDIKKQ